MSKGRARIEGAAGRVAGRGVATALAGVLMTMLVAACGGSSGTGPGGGPDPGTAPAGEPATGPVPEAPAEGSDPCTLLTEDEVAAAVGAEVTRTDGPIDDPSGSGMRQCTWAFPFEGEENYVAVQVFVGRDNYNPDPERGPETEVDPVPGIGDEAHRILVFDDLAPTCSTIFRKGEIVVQVITLWIDESACVDLARAAVTRV